MRTTVTLDPDVEAQLTKLMRERGIGFKEAINTALRDALLPAKRKPRSYTRSTDMGEPRFDVTKALQYAGALEDAETLRKLQLGK